MNQLVVTVIVILLPGVIATIICNKLIVHSKWSQFEFSVYSLVLGGATYVVLQIFAYLFAIARAQSIVNPGNTLLEVWGSLTSNNPSIPEWEVIIAMGVAIPVAFFVSYLDNHKIINKIGQQINFTAKYGDENLYSYYLNSKEINWIYVRDREKNLTYLGRVVSHSENERIQELVLSEVTVFRYEDSAELYSVPTMYLSKEIGKFIIEQSLPSDSLGGQNDKETAA